MIEFDRIISELPNTFPLLADVPEPVFLSDILKEPDQNCLIFFFLTGYRFWLFLDECYRTRRKHIWLDHGAHYNEQHAQHPVPGPTETGQRNCGTTEDRENNRRQINA